MSLHWLKTRWRTRGEYSGRARRLLTRVGCALGGPILLIGAILYGLFWVLSEPSRAGERSRRIDELAGQIVAAVEGGNFGGSGDPVELDELVASGVLGADDVDFLADEGVTYQPIHRSSHDTAVVFRRADGSVEHVHRKNGTEDFYRRAVSPDGRHQVLIGPPRPGAAPAAGGHWSVTVRTVPGTGETARILAALTVPDFARAHWSPDGRFVAIEARPAGASYTAQETFVLAVSPTGARRIDLPASLHPSALLAPADRSARLQSTTVRVIAWRDARLVVASEGTGWIGPPGDATSRYVTVDCRITLEVSAGGVRELERRC
jgi:hypothetical protein